MNVCRGTVFASVVLVERVREAGLVRRYDVGLAIYQCAVYHRIVPDLARDGASIHEETRFGWQVIHFAAALGIVPLIDDVLALGARLDARTKTGATRCTSRRRTVRSRPQVASQRP